MDVISIVDWAKNYEINRTRELKRMTWVPMPNKHDGYGYTTLVDHPNGPAHFGAWCALVEVASKCNPRGTLLRGDGLPHDPDSLFRVTRLPVSLWKEALPRLASIGWISIEEIPQGGAGMSHRGAVIPHKGATTPQDAADRGEGVPALQVLHTDKKEGREAPQGGAGLPHPRPPLSAPPSPQDQEEQAMMVEIMEIHKKATKGALLPQMTDAEMAQLLSLFRQHGGEKVVAAYRQCQKEKPGKLMKFFLQDFAVYFAKLPGASPPIGPACKYCGTHGDYHTPSCNRPGNPAGLPSEEEHEDVAAGDTGDIF